MLKKLEGAQTKLNNSQTAGCGQLGSFINQVNAFLNNGSLTTSQGQALINAANAIKNQPWLLVGASKERAWFR